jgi:thiol-disulfide isomerase/thioredoxin
VSRALLAAIATLAALSGCGPDDPASRPVDPRLLEGAPAPLGELHERGNELVDGDAAAFRAQLAKLKGYPVVVNKWASWCAPCRAEFPHFQNQSGRLAKRVAFIGVNSNDNDEDARRFLEEYPVPYPSFKDPSLKIAGVFGGIGFPTTAFYDSKGEVAYVKQGAYLSEEDLIEDLQRYAR